MSKPVRIVTVDHPIVRSGYRAILECHAGWTVCGEGSSGQDAIGLAHSLHPDVLILDTELPELGGEETVRAIRQVSPDTEVLVVSMDCPKISEGRPCGSGARGCLLKSETPRMLVAAVEAVSRRETFFPTQQGARPTAAALLEDSLFTPAPRLTSREREVASLLAQGRTNKQVALQLGISVKTAEVHRSNIMRRLNLHSVADLVRYAIRQGMVES